MLQRLEPGRGPVEPLGGVGLDVGAGDPERPAGAWDLDLGRVDEVEVVVASGVDGIYPKGFLIGRVERSERGTGLYRNITVRPAVDFSSVEEVLVVLVPPRPATRDEGVQ